jgi:pimeloyl-ACP methyl ester carboxylesterase
MTAATSLTATRMRTFRNDGMLFSVIDSGPVDGSGVVLLHGFPQRASCWAGVSAALHERGYRTLAPDQRGYALEARPRSRAAYRLPALVGDVAALLGRLPGPVHLVGHDWGALVAWAVAAQDADQQRGLVRSLVTVSAPHPRAFARALLSSSQAVRSLYVGAFQLPLLPETLARAAPRLVENGLARSGMPKAARQRFRQEMVEDGALGTALNWYRALILPPFTSVGPVQVPTTHVWSDRDRALSRTGAERSGEHVQAPYRLEVLEGVSHWIPDEVPETLARLIDERAQSALPADGGAPRLGESRPPRKPSGTSRAVAAAGPSANRG